MWGGPEAVFCDFGPVFGLIFGNCSNQKHWFLRYFVFCRSLTAIFKTAKTIVNTIVLCRPVAKNLANTIVFGRWVKKHCKLRCFWPPDLQKPRYLQFCLPGHKNIVKNVFLSFLFMFQFVSCFELGQSDRRGMHIFSIYIYMYMCVCVCVLLCYSVYFD